MTRVDSARVRRTFTAPLKRSQSLGRNPWRGPSRCLFLGLAALGLACCANCQGTSSQQPPHEPESAVPATNGGTAQAATATTQPVDGNAPNKMTQAELDECMDGCFKSQSDHPEETPYDCRALCLDGQMQQGGTP